MKTFTTIVILSTLFSLLAGCGSGGSSPAATNQSPGSGEAFLQKLEATPVEERPNLLIENKSTVDEIGKSNDQSLKDRLRKAMAPGG